MIKINWEELGRINHKYLVKFNKNVKFLQKNNQYILGKKVEDLENKIASYVGVKYAVAVGNCLDGLTITLKTFDFPSDSEVIVPSNTFYATVLAILRNNLKPVLCEPDINSFNITADDIEKLITPKTVAIMPVHLYGKPCEMKKIMKIAKKYKLKVIEDCAQGFGASLGNQKVGSFGDYGVFSFYPTKNLGSISDGGIITTNNKDLADKCKILRSYGGNNYRYDILGINTRMDETTAIFLLEKLKDIEKINAKKINFANLYQTKINNPNIILPKIDTNEKHVYYIYAIRSKRRDELQKYLKDNGIESLVHYPIPLYKQKALSNFINKEYLISKEISDTVLSLPCSAGHTKKEILKVIEIINNFK